MYKTTDSEKRQLCFLHFNQPYRLQLDINNEWVKHADLLPLKSMGSSILVTNIFGSFKLAVEELEKETE